MAETITTNSIHIIVPILVGILIGLLEVFFVFKDESNALGESVIKDGWHGLTTSIIGTFIASNVPWILTKIPLPEWIVNYLMIDPEGRSVVVSGIITIILITKMVISKSIKGNIDGVKEKFIHKLIIASLAGFSPYYIFLLYPIIKQYLGNLPYL